MAAQVAFLLGYVSDGRVQSAYCMVFNKLCSLPLWYYNMGYCRYVFARHDLRVAEDVNAKQVQVKPEARLAMSPTMSRGVDYCE